MTAKAASRGIALLGGALLLIVSALVPTPSQAQSQPSTGYRQDEPHPTPELGPLRPGRMYWGAAGHRDQGGPYAAIPLSRQISDLKNIFGDTPNTIVYRALGDGMHAGYIGDKPGPLESKLDPANLEVWIKFARDAVAGHKRFVVTHSEIFPGTFASTTETADYLLAQLGLTRRAVLRWGPMGLQQLSEAKAGRFLLLGYAGNSAPDHVDQLQSLPVFLKLLLR